MIAAHIVARAKVRIEDECARRGIRLRGAIDRCGPCPRCGGTDRFAINLKKQVFHCRGCKIGGDVIELVRTLDQCSFPEAVELLSGDRIRQQASQPIANKQQQTIEQYEAEQHRKAEWLWSQRKPISGTIAERYLRARGITCGLPATLGFLPSRKPEHRPAMITAFGLIDEPEPSIIGEPRKVMSVHLTLLKSDGTGKANVEKPKLVVGAPGNLPIVLAPVNDLLGLAVTEGIEDALTAYAATGLGAWVAGSAGRMPKLADVIPGHVECVTIYAHNDDNEHQAGQRVARELAEALHRRGIEVIIEGVR
jgi:hypothetical protein